MRSRTGFSWAGGLTLALCVGLPLAGANSLPPLLDIAQIGVGRGHSCALTETGAVLCWGANETGQLGLGTLDERVVRTTPVPLPGLASGQRLLAVGDSHNCEADAVGEVRCWGLNGEGAVGNGSGTYAVPQAEPVQGLGAPARALDAGGEHSCAILDDGSLACWGNNAAGQLGDGSTVSRPHAAAVVGLPGTVRQVSLGAAHSCALLDDGAVFCWGRNDGGQLGDGSRTDRDRPVRVADLPGPARWIAAGNLASCALDAGGALYCWGPQYPLAAFDGGADRARAYPGFAAGYVAVEGGSAHFCALHESRSVKCLGDNAFGQLGTGPIDDSLGAEFVLGLERPVTRLASGGWHNCGLLDDGQLRCWGLNTEGQLGIDSVTRRSAPTLVAGLGSGVQALAAGGFSGCALTLSGGVRCWGNNDNGEVGDGSGRFRLTAVDVVGLDRGVRAIDAGDGSACALTDTGTVKCWGANFDGRLGTGDFLNRLQPTDVVGLGTAASAIAVGRQHACALGDGAVSCWGDNEFGQLGSGDNTARPQAQPVVELGGRASALAAGYYHGCAVVDGDVRCWGNNEFGQLGDGSRETRLQPVTVQGLPRPARSVSAGIVHSCALLEDASLHCWGAGFFGLLLGDGSEPDRLLAGPVPALGNRVAEVSLGNFHSCVRLLDGAMRCWGQGGAVGDNSLIARPLPTAVAGLDRGVSAISAGFGSQSCAVQAGAAYCWGENTFAQLGDGSSHGVPIAQVVLDNTPIRRVTPIEPAQLIGAGVDGPSSDLQFDQSGRLAVFASAAGGLVEEDDNGVRDIFLLDRETGAVQRLSLDNTGAELATPSSMPSVSGDGRLVTFVTTDAAPAALLGETKAQRDVRRKGSGLAVFLRNVTTGTTQRVATTLAGAGKPQFAADGRSLVFSALAQAGQGQPGQVNVFRSGLTPNGEAVAIGQPVCLSCQSRSPDGTPAGNADGDSGHAVISADGLWVAYETKAGNALAGTPTPCPAGSSQVMLRNALTGTTTRISPPPGLPAAACGSAGSQKPSIDHRGQVIALQSDQDLVAGDRNGLDDVYVWRQGVAGLSRLSAVGDGDASAAAAAPVVSGDGQHVAFVSQAPEFDLAAADNNDRGDLHSVALADPSAVRRLSRTADGNETDGDSGAPVLSFDGSELGFASNARNLLPGASSGQVQRVFVRDNPLAPNKRSATWWVAAEDGWGLTVFDQGNLLAPTWFTYDSDGEPTWFIVSGALPQADGSFRGDLFRFTGVPLAQIDGPAARTAEPVGEVVLRYQGDAVLQFDYRVGDIEQSKTLRRFPFGERGFRCSAAAADRRLAVNYTDLWSGEGDDAGWGLTLFHVDDLLVAVWYTYDDDGEAVFFLVTTTREASGDFSGQVFRQRDGTPFSLIDGNQPSPGSDEIGSARFRFLQGDLAEFSYTLGSVQQTRRIGRLQVGDQATVCRSENETR